MFDTPVQRPQEELQYCTVAVRDYMRRTSFTVQGECPSENCVEWSRSMMGLMQPSFVEEKLWFWVIKFQIARHFLGSDLCENQLLLGHAKSHANNLRARASGRTVQFSSAQHCPLLILLLLLLFLINVVVGPGAVYCSSLSLLSWNLC